MNHSKSAVAQQNQILKAEGKKEQRRRRAIEKELREKYSQEARRKDKTSELNKMLDLLKALLTDLSVCSE